MIRVFSSCFNAVIAIITPVKESYGVMESMESCTFNLSSKSSFPVHRKVGENAKVMECYLTLLLEMEVNL